MASKGNNNMVTLTAPLAHASGMDAGNKQMRKAGRTKWNDDDYNLAVVTTNRLLMHVPMDRGGLEGVPVADLQARGLI